MAARYFEAVGRRKEASARVRLYPGTGKIIVNDKELADYFPRERDRLQLMEPLEVTGNVDSFNVTVLVRGGGITGQAGAVRLGVARALLASDENLRKVLRGIGCLTRDSRMKERKKYGLKRARKAPQYTKR
jgi:small subunit ribosomal protein S9